MSMMVQKLYICIMKKNESIEVGQYQHLPEHLKLKTYKSTDAIITAYSQKGTLKGVEKIVKEVPRLRSFIIWKLDELMKESWINGNKTLIYLGKDTYEEFSI